MSASTASLQPALILRLTQTGEGEGRHQVEIVLEGDGPRRMATARFAFAMSAQDQENQRWYLEDYLEVSRRAGAPDRRPPQAAWERRRATATGQR